MIVELWVGKVSHAFDQSLRRGGFTNIIYVSVDK